MKNTQLARPHDLHIFEAVYKPQKNNLLISFQNTQLHPYFNIQSVTSFSTYIENVGGVFKRESLLINLDKLRYVGLSFCATKSSLIIEIVTPGIPRFFCAPA